MLAWRARIYSAAMVRRAIVLALFVLPVAAGACSGSKGRGASNDGDESGDDGDKNGSTGDSAPKAMEQILEAHNRYRKKHCAPPLEWSDDIAEQAQSWADKLEKRGCAFDHSSSGYGENLAAGTESVMDADRAVEIWYEEKQHYRGGFSMQAGHYTQLVWVGSKRLGCGTTTCQGKRIWVCNYDPPGNVQGQYPSNVKSAGCKK